MILNSGFADPTLQGRTADLAIPEADKVLLLLKQLPQHVVLHIQLHGKTDTYQNVCETVRNYDLRRVQGERIPRFDWERWWKGQKERERRARKEVRKKANLAKETRQEKAKAQGRKERDLRTDHRVLSHRSHPRSWDLVSNVAKMVT